MPRRKKIGAFLRTFIALSFAVGLFGAGTLALWAATLKVPDIESFSQRKVEQSTKIYDRTGEVLLFDVHADIKRTVIPLEETSRNIRNTTVAIEDAEFYQHNGIKLRSIVRAILVNIGALEFSQGGSTITQQVIKNSLLTSEKKISRKLKEWVLSIKLEQQLSKEQILELYLNEAPYGGNIYGIEEASQAFFGVSAASLNLQQAAYLAALPQAPTYYSPYGNNADKLEERKNLVLAKTFENGFITDAEYQEALNMEVPFLPQKTSGIEAPHFVFLVREYLERQYGKRALDERGFRVITTLDHELQQIAQDIVYKFALENVEKFNAENAGLVAIDPRTGYILAMVGSRDYFDTEIDGNFNVTLAKRQPGSAFKPFVYATAIKKGYTPETVVFDLKTQFSTTCKEDDFTSDGECYSPTNFDDTFQGPVTFREALAQSINIPAIKVLYLAGLSDSLRTAKDMGISTLTDISRYGLTLVLGGGEVTLLELTSAYGVFANEGVRNPIVSILRIEDFEGNVIEEFTPRPRRVLDEEVARTITDIISDNDARAPAFGEYSYLYFPGQDVAAKTGTTNDFRDAWIVGYTPNIAVGAWAGNNDNSRMEKKVAGFIIAPLWRAFMDEALAQLPKERFKSPVAEVIDDLPPRLRGFWRGGESYFIDTITGKLATQYTPEEVKEERVLLSVHSALYWIDKDNPRSSPPKQPEENPQFRLWEYPIQLWKEQNGFADENETIPTEVDDVHLPEFIPQLAITSPAPNTRYDRTSVINVSFTHTSKFPLSKVEVFVNGVFIDSVNKQPFLISFVPADVANIQQKNTLVIIGYDNVFNRGEATVDFTVDL